MSPYVCNFDSTAMEQSFTYDSTQFTVTIPSMTCCLIKQEVAGQKIIIGRMEYPRLLNIPDFNTTLDLFKATIRMPGNPALELDPLARHYPQDSTHEDVFLLNRHACSRRLGFTFNQRLAYATRYEIVRQSSMPVYDMRSIGFLDFRHDESGFNLCFEDEKAVTRHDVIALYLAAVALFVSCKCMI
ncbi:hypothetical protein CPB84DRAFT_1748764 [Gymnopilus junonius]|uniref:Uncharacterized protein n=1 Tax=Gymnopilus junonius TaxID=109634 RepID=A0A9P5TLQ8_GYMJU|nr:hypothetical protein CPB84DRAFT_1748764 [Gymnopilus junonius]